MNYDAIMEQARALQDEVVAYRRRLHRNPETGFDTRQTETFVREVLAGAGIEMLPAKIGVLGLIRTERADRSDGYVALRADMDALELEEKNDVPYRSQVSGRMHACGHDGHTAMLLAAARVLSANRASLPRDVLLVFQPAEEGPDMGGAIVMLQDLEEKGLVPRIAAMAALHLTNEYPAGTLGIRYGSAMASTDDFDITITGRGGHCGLPHKAVDPISIGAKFVTGMESFLSRAIDPFDPVVFAIGTFHAGSGRNIIPQTVTMSGTLRAQSEENRAYILESAEKLLQGLSLYTGAEVRMDVEKILPVLVNDDNTTKQAEAVARKVAGDENVVVLKNSNMGAEDFAFFAQKIPATFAWLGGRNEEKGFVHMIHSPQFDIDERALVVGVKYLCRFALEIR